MTAPSRTGSRIAQDRGGHFAEVLHSEFCKIRSVPSTFWTLSAAVAANIVLAALVAILVPSRLTASDQAGTDGVRLALAGVHLSQIAFGVLGVLVITSEYGTGMIRATFAAVPQRRLVLAAKTLVFAAVALVLGVLSSVAAYYTFQAFLPGDIMRSSIGDPAVLRAVLGGGLYLTVLGLLGLGLGAIIRSSAGAIATLLGLLFVPSLLISLLPQSWQATVGPYAPMDAGSQVFIAVQHDPRSLSTWAGFGVFSLYAAIALTVGFILIDRRDT